MIFKNLPTWFWKDWKNPDFYFVLSQWRDGITQSETFFFSLSKRNPSLFLFFTMKISICTPKNITGQKKKKRNSGRMFPSQNWIKWHCSFLEGMKEICKFLPDPSTTTYYYTHSLFMCFTGDLLHHPTKVKVKAQIVDQPFPCLQSECCYFSSHGSFQISKQL